MWGNIRACLHDLPFLCTIGIRDDIDRERKPMSTKLVNLRIDFAFKQLFGTKGNEEILTGFLNAILEESLDAPITSLQLDRSTSP